LIPISGVTHNLELGLSDIQFGLQKRVERGQKISIEETMSQTEELAELSSRFSIEKYRLDN